MWRWLKFLGVVLLVLIVVVVARTIFIPSRQIAGLPHTPEQIDAQKVIRDLSGTIPFQTISWEGGGTDEQKKAAQDAFAGFHSYLEKAFPQVYVFNMPEREGLVVVGSMVPGRLDAAALLAAGAALDRRFRATFSFRDMAGRLVR